MTTPLIILAILTTPYLVLSAIERMQGRSDLGPLGGALGLSFAFLFFGFGHFAVAGPMTRILPPEIPYRLALIYVTGLMEIALGLALLFPRWRRAAGWAAIALLVLFFPANIYGALTRADFGAHEWGPAYLLIRTPLQIILIAWAYWFAVRAAGKTN